MTSGVKTSLLPIKAQRREESNFGIVEGRLGGHTQLSDEATRYPKFRTPYHSNGGASPSSFVFFVIFVIWGFNILYILYIFIFYIICIFCIFYIFCVFL